MITSKVFVFYAFISFSGVAFGAFPALEKLDDVAVDTASWQSNGVENASNDLHEPTIVAPASASVPNDLEDHSHDDQRLDEHSNVLPVSDEDLHVAKQRKLDALVAVRRATVEVNQSGDISSETNVMPEQSTIAANITTSAGNMNLNRLVRYMKEKANSEIRLFYHIINVIQFANEPFTGNATSMKTSLSKDELTRMKQKVSHQLMIVQEHVMQYEYYRYQNATDNNVYDMPDMWMETYNVEAAARIASTAESSDGINSPQAIQCIVDARVNGNLEQLTLLQKRRPCDGMQPFLPLRNRGTNGFFSRKQEQHQTIFSDHRAGQKLITEYLYKQKSNAIRHVAVAIEVFVGQLKTGVLTTAENNDAKNSLSKLLQDIQLITAEVWLSRPPLAANSVDTEMQTLFAFVHTLAQAAAPLLDATTTAPLRVKYANEKYVIVNQNDQILIKVEREHVKERTFIRFSESENQTFGKLKMDALQARLLMFMNRLRREFALYNKLLAKFHHLPYDAYQVTIPDKLGLIQAYLLAINRINHSRVSTQQLYEKLYELESNALEIVSPLHRLTTLNKYGRVTLNYLSPNVQKGEYPPLSQSPFTQHNNAGDKMK